MLVLADSPPTPAKTTPTRNPIAVIKTVPHDFKTTPRFCTRVYNEREPPQNGPSSSDVHLVTST